MPRLVLPLLAGCCLAGGMIQLAFAGDAYKPDPGPYAIHVEASVALPYPELEKDLLLRVTYPEARDGESPEGEKYPLIIFSHGGRCSRDAYTEFADHWASHGYIVVQPAHLDSLSIEPPANLRGMQMMNTAVLTRRMDLPYIIDSISTIEALVPALRERIDAERIVAAGHSLGGATAMAVTGVIMVDPSTDQEFGFLDERFDALLLITNPGNSPMMPDDPWRFVALPTLVTTGTNDVSSLARAIKSKSVFQFPEGAQFADTPNHYLFIDDMNHYLGGLICKPRPGDTPDRGAARIINGVSIAFLDAYMKDDAVALAFLNGQRMPDSVPRATLLIK